MRKLTMCLIPGCIFLYLAVGLNAQSSEEELDQVDLMKQFLGDWKADQGKDTIWYYHFSSSDKGFDFKFKSQAKGETYNHAHGIIGFVNDYQRVTWYTLMKNGWTIRDHGQFKSKDKLVMKRFNANHEVNYAKWEWTFISPDKAKVVYTSREWSAENWDNAEVFETIFDRVN